MPRLAIALCVSGLLLSSVLVARSAAQGGPAPNPVARLYPASPITLTGRVDSNSPSLWQLVDGQSRFFLMTSIDGHPSTATGDAFTTLGTPSPINLTPWPGGGVWMEAVIPDVDGTWYGYYHNEVPATACGADSTRVAPRIGAARSVDHGLTWESLGIVIDAPPGTDVCGSPNKYLVGGVGDFSVMLDPDSRDLYFFVSQYYRSPSEQGVAVARIAWADRDAPVGKAMLWSTSTWIPASRQISTKNGAPIALYRAASPLFPTTQPWHQDTAVDAFWGPSVHYNTYLNEYVMLLNRAKDESFDEEGIYVSYSPRLDDPRAWTTPVKLLNGGAWYPQVIGLDTNGTDKLAGAVARFFMSGKSSFAISFTR